MPRPSLPRPYRRPSNSLLSEPEAKILAWARLGGSVWCAAQLAGQNICEVERWIEQGRANPGGPHGMFSRQMRALEQPYAAMTTMSGQFGLRARQGLQNGNGSENGHAEIISWQDL